MPYLIVRHKVKDFATWKPVFDEHGALRKANGSKGGLLLRNADDPDEVVVFLEWDTLENAHRFANAPNLREAMEHSGVVAKPDVYFLNEVGRVTA